MSLQMQYESISGSKTSRYITGASKMENQSNLKSSLEEAAGSRGSSKRTWSLLLRSIFPQVAFCRN